MNKDNKTTKKKSKSLLKIIATDFIGVLLIICSALLGWLPGPGGIPLLLGGLSLLASNHKWARNLLNKLKNNGGKLFKTLFNDNPKLKILYDVFSVLLVIIAGLIFGLTRKDFWQGFALVLILLAVSVFISNRERHKSLYKFIQKIQKKKKQS